MVVYNTINYKTGAIPSITPETSEIIISLVFVFDKPIITVTLADMIKEKST